MSRAAAIRLVCKCLAPGRSVDPRELGPGLATGAALVEAASTHLVAPAMSHALREKGLVDFLEPSIVDYFDGVAILNRQRNARIRTEAIGVARSLNALGVAPVLLKGAANLLAGLYPSPADRMMTDLDVMVPRAALAECVAALRRQGYVELHDNGFPAHHHYPPLGRPGDAASLELHVEPLDLPYRRLLPANDIVASAAAWELEGARFAVPSPWSRIVHSIAHAELADRDYLLGRLPIRDLLDLALLTNPPGGIDWALIRQRFNAIGAGAALHFHLLAAERLFGLPRNPPTPATTYARILYRRAIWQADRPGWSLIGERLLRPTHLLSRALSHPQLRRRLLRSLLDPAWLRRQWRMLSGKPIA